MDKITVASDKRSNRSSTETPKSKAIQQPAKESPLPDAQRASLVELETKYVFDNKPTVVQILRDLVKIQDGQIDSGFRIETQERKLESSGTVGFLDEYIKKLKKASNIQTTDLIRRIHEEIRFKQSQADELIKSNSEKELKRVQNGILNMQHVVHRLELCGNAVNPLANSLGVEKSDNYRLLNGVLYCGKMLCPRCCTHQAINRARDLEAKIGAIIKKGEVNLFLVTFTLRHHDGVNFKVLQQALYKAFSGMIRCSWWPKAVKGFVKHLEVTYTTGYHAHLHAIIALNKDDDAGEFSERIAGYWEKKAKKLGRSCDWSKMNNEWFKKINGSEFKQVINYFINHDIKTNYNIVNEITSTHLKDKAPWNMPVEKYCEIYKQSKGIRWFATSGIFKLDTNVENENENDASDLSSNINNKEKKVLLSIDVKVWRKLDLGDKFLIRSIIIDKSINDNNCIKRIKSIINEYLDACPQLNPLLS